MGGRGRAWVRLDVLVFGAAFARGGAGARESRDAGDWARVSWQVMPGQRPRGGQRLAGLGGRGKLKAEWKYGRGCREADHGDAAHDAAIEAGSEEDAGAPDAAGDDGFKDG